VTKQTQSHLLQKLENTLVYMVTLCYQNVTTNVKFAPVES